MVYEWGSKPQYEREELVSDDYTFGKNEWGCLRGHAFRHTYFAVSGRVLPYPTEKVFAEHYTSEITKRGAVVKYIRVRMEIDRTTQYVMGLSINYDTVTWTVEECAFVGDPFPLVGWLVVGLIVILGIGIVVLYKPVFFKWFGVTPLEAVVGELGTMGVLGIGIIAILVFFVVLVPIVTGRKRR